MKKLYFSFGVLLSSFYFSQTLIGNVNSGAVSDANLMHSVGEIFVVPTNTDQTNSGTIGMLYQTSLSFLGLKELQANDIKFYPNPTSDILYFSVKSKMKLEEVQIFDLSGRNVVNLKITKDLINLSLLSSGEYFLVFKNSDIKPIKIIKK